MSFATSTEPSTHMTSGSLRAGAASGRDAEPSSSAALKPWQFFLLAGMLGATASVVVATGQSMPAIVALSLTVVAVSLVGLGTYRMLLPFVRPQALRAADVSSARGRAALEREKTLVLRAIKDLEFDRAMGKVAVIDFDEMSGRLRARAVDLLRQLDGSDASRARLEEELAARLAKTPMKAAASQAPVSEPTATAEQACAACGTENDRDARFCKSCGARLEAAQ